MENIDNKNGEKIEQEKIKKKSKNNPAWRPSKKKAGGPTGGGSLKEVKAFKT